MKKSDKKNYIEPEITVHENLNVATKGDIQDSEVD